MPSLGAPSVHRPPPTPADARARSAIAAAAGPTRRWLKLVAPVPPADPDAECAAALEAMEEDPYFFYNEARDGDFEQYEPAFADLEDPYEEVREHFYAAQKGTILEKADGAPVAPRALLPALGAWSCLQARRTGAGAHCVLPQQPWLAPLNAAACCTPPQSAALQTPPAAPAPAHASAPQCRSSPWTA